MSLHVLRFVYIHTHTHACTHTHARTYVRTYVPLSTKTAEQNVKNRNPPLKNLPRAAASVENDYDAWQ